MKKYLEQLRPMERRLVVGVGVIFLVVLNAVFIWPHFSDWGRLQGRMAKARSELARNEAASAKIPELQTQVKQFASEGEFVAPEDQAINLMRTIQSQAAASGFGIQNFSRAMTRTNDAFFVEQVQNITVAATEEQLVDFLYKLGSGSSMIRVRDLELAPDPPRQRLIANIKLVASFQKSPKPAAPVTNAPAAQPSTAKAK
jgi:type II secretory pathway component PulM